MLQLWKSVQNIFLCILKFYMYILYFLQLLTGSLYSCYATISCKCTCRATWRYVWPIQSIPRPVSMLSLTMAFPEMRMASHDMTQPRRGIWSMSPGTSISDEMSSYSATKPKWWIFFSKFQFIFIQTTYCILNILCGLMMLAFQIVQCSKHRSLPVRLENKLHRSTWFFLLW